MWGADGGAVLLLEVDFPDFCEVLYEFPVYAFGGIGGQEVEDVFLTGGFQLPDELDGDVFFPPGGEGLIFGSEGSGEVKAVGLDDVFGAKPAVELVDYANILGCAHLFFGGEGIIVEILEDYAGEGVDGSESCLFIREFICHADYFRRHSGADLDGSGYVGYVHSGYASHRFVGKSLASRSVGFVTLPADG